MKRIFSNHKNLKIDDLLQSNLYPYYLLENLMHRNFSDLNLLPVNLKSDINYMEPILYAVRNELGTFEVYKYYAENLQEDTLLGAEIIKVEPHLIENTPLSENSDFILQNIEASPQVIRYMSPTLKVDSNVIGQICSTNNKSVLKEVALSCDSKVVAQAIPEWRNNKEFVYALALENPQSALVFAGNSLKNDSQFLKDLASQNDEVVDVIVANSKEYNTKCISEIQQVAKNSSMLQCMNTCKNLSEKTGDKRYSSVEKYIEAHGSNDSKSFLAATAMSAQKEDLDPDSIKKIFNYSLLTMEKITREMSASEDYVPTKEHLLELVSAINIRKLRGTLEKQGIPLSPEMQQQLDNYEIFQRNYVEKYKEYKNKSRKESSSLSHESSVQNKSIPKSDFSQIINGVKFSDVQKITDITNLAMTKERKTKDSIDFNDSADINQSGNLEEFDK